VTVAGKVWGNFNAAEETITFTAADLTPTMVSTGITTITAVFAATHRVSLRRAKVNFAKRVVPAKPAVIQHLAESTADHFVSLEAAQNGSAPIGTAVTALATPKCPAGATRVEEFAINGTAWAACEDLHGSRLLDRRCY
jgi:hypothetical protein